jgi:predicted small secreted protein
VGRNLRRDFGVPGERRARFLATILKGEKEGRMTRTQKFGRMVLAPIFVVVCALVLAGCKSGTITGSEQTCKSEGGLLAGRKVTCTGSVGAVRGEPSLGIIDADGDLSGNYKLDATITAGKGEAKAYVSTADGGKQGGKVSPGEPLRIGAVVGLGENDEEVSVNLKVLGKEVQDLSYEATVAPQ